MFTHTGTTLMQWYAKPRSSERSGHFVSSSCRCSIFCICRQSMIGFSKRQDFVRFCWVRMSGRHWGRVQIFWRYETQCFCSSAFIIDHDSSCLRKWHYRCQIAKFWPSCLSYHYTTRWKNIWKQLQAPWNPHSTYEMPLNVVWKSLKSIWVQRKHTIHMLLGQVHYFLFFPCPILRTHHHTVLHPCLRSHWFATTSESDDECGAQQAIRKAEVIFRFVAKSYLKTQLEPPLVPAIPKLVSKPVTKTPSFLASACSFQQPAVAMTATISKWTPCEALNDELTQYFNFEAAPGDQGCEQSAEDILLNPLLWWKVCCSSSVFVL